MSDYPSEAYVDDVPWWDLESWPGTRRVLGDEPRIAAWLAYNKSIGETFTTDELREALGHRLSRTSRNDREHFQRRIRELRSHRDGWEFPSTKHDRNVDMGSYRLDRVGWHPALGSRPRDDTKASKKLRLQVLQRDNYRCFHCGAISREPHPAAPETTTVMTIGHINPGLHGGRATLANLRAECSLCNETARAATIPAESLRHVRESVNNFSVTDRRRLRDWVESKRRLRDRVDEAYDQYRLLTVNDQEAFAAWISKTT